MQQISVVENNHDDVPIPKTPMLRFNTIGPGSCSPLKVINEKYCKSPKKPSNAFFENMETRHTRTRKSPNKNTSEDIKPGKNSIRRLSTDSPNTIHGSKNLKFALESNQPSIQAKITYDEQHKNNIIFDENIINNATIRYSRNLTQKEQIGYSDTDDSQQVHSPTKNGRKNLKVDVNCTRYTFENFNNNNNELLKKGETSSDMGDCLTPGSGSKSFKNSSTKKISNFKHMHEIHSGIKSSISPNKKKYVESRVIEFNCEEGENVNEDRDNSYPSSANWKKTSTYERLCGYEQNHNSTENELSYKNMPVNESMDVETSITARKKAGFVGFSDKVKTFASQKIFKKAGDNSNQDFAMTQNVYKSDSEKIRYGNFARTDMIPSNRRTKVR